MIKRVYDLFKYTTFMLLWISVVYGAGSYLTGMYPLNEQYGWGVFFLLVISLYMNEAR